jgi:hypothetical protein
MNGANSHTSIYGRSRHHDPCEVVLRQINETKTLACLLLHAIIYYQRGVATIQKLFSPK